MKSIKYLLLNINSIHVNDLNLFTNLVNCVLAQNVRKASINNIYAATLRCSIIKSYILGCTSTLVAINAFLKRRKTRN